MNSFILSALVVTMVMLAVLGETEDGWYGNQEAACMRQGGLCILHSECTQPIGQNGELCPLQASQGFQCCFGLPRNEKRCSMRGGECNDKGFCSKNQVYSEASDCEAKEVCCMFI